MQIMSNKKSGYYVETKGGKRGRTYSNEKLVDGKVKVTLETERFKFNGETILCDPNALILKGFLD
jgi:hypothetical protein